MTRVRRPMHPILLPLLLLLTLPLSLWAACEPPETPFTYDARAYYAEALEREGEKLHKALNQAIRGHRILGADCAASLAGPHEYWPRRRGFPDDIQDAFSDAHNRTRTDFAWLQASGEPAEVPARERGNLARALFYMAVRYQGDDESLTPDLKLVRGKPEKDSLDTGGLCTLLQWHADDPVDEAERQRQEQIFRLQGNRNPFVDHPEFAAAIWQNRCALGGGDNQALDQVLQRIEAMEQELADLKRRVKEMRR
jgi:hypothetical protein